MKIRCILNAIEEFAPRALQESYDNAGLQAGDAANDCSGVLLTLDVTEQTVQEAKERGCNLIISHHPLLFHGIKSISPSNSTGRILINAIRNNIAIYSAHTNLDNARGGVSYRIADKLGMTDVATLQPQKGSLSKIVVFVPSSHADSVAEALFANGAGRIGNYDSCSYRMDGYGSFRAGSEANPYVGNRGELHHEPETRLEVIIHSSDIGRALPAMIAAHPYEEPAFDIIPLANTDKYSGSGVIGNIQPIEYELFLLRLKDVFGTKAVRFCGNPKSMVKRIALCGGSGAFLIGDAIAQDADVMVTGDLKYHDFTENAGKIMLADIGHYESEQVAKNIFNDIIQEKFPDIATYFAETDINPINYI